MLLVQKRASAVSLLHVEHGHDGGAGAEHAVVRPRTSGSLSSSVSVSDIKYR